MSTFPVDVESDKPEPAAAAPPARRRGMFYGLLAMVFLSGGVAGGGLGMMLAERQFSECIRHPERLPDRMMLMLRSNLTLSDEQTTRIQSIISEHHEKIEAIRAEVHPRMSAEFKAIGEEISQVLDDSQRAKWKELQARFPKDGPPRRKRDRSDEHAK